MLQWFPDAGYQSARTGSPREGNKPGTPCDCHRLLPAEFPAVGSCGGCLSVWAEEMKLGGQRSREGHQRGEVRKLAPEMCVWGEPECGARRPRRKEQRHNHRVSRGPGPGRVASSQNPWVGNEEEKGSSSKSCSGPAKQRLKANPKVSKWSKCLQ